jgi:hypothetical protein
VTVLEAPHTSRARRASDARWTGVFYLGLAIAAAAGFIIVRGQIYVADDPAATLANLVDHAPLARLGIAADMTVVLTQALAALWFFKLFRQQNAFAAGAITAFGLVNAVAILVATAFSATALAVGGTPALAAGGDQAATVQTLYELQSVTWDLGGLFFGLWLIPMGYVVVTSRLMPLVLGWVLLVGGVAYVAGTYLSLVAPDLPTWVGDVLVGGVATVGELWMIGYLLVIGVRTRMPEPVPSQVL